MGTIDTLQRPAALLRGRKLEYFTIAWNTLEGLVGVIAGAVAGSISLIGFGIDSFIEVTSGSVLLWRMSVDSDVHRRETNEKRALRIVGACFLLLAAYITYDSISDLWSKRAPEHSMGGIILACASLVVMPMLSRAKRKVGRALGSAAMLADSKQTEFCTYLSAILLVGLVLNAFFGFWWADPLAALIHGSYHRQRRYRRIAWASMYRVLQLTSMQFRMLSDGFGFQDETSVCHDFLLHMQSFNYGMIAICCGT
jgi:divalent metal cation (Fe/Co/Zn/Cd) transporter